MNVGMFGISHHSSDIKAREELMQTCSYLTKAKPSTVFQDSYVLLFTCNRVEVYFSSSDLLHTYYEWIRFINIKNLYVHFNEECFVHLARVAAGLDSALVGETEIQGQVKKAYENGSLNHFLPHELHFLFQKSLQISKKVRYNIDVPPTLGKTIIGMSEEIFGNLRIAKILFVGLSEINNKICRQCLDHGCQNITLCNRSDENAFSLANELNVKYIPWSEMHKWSSFDVVVFATKSPTFLISEASFMEGNVIVMDLGVPRNVDPILSKTRGVALFNMDQIISKIDKNTHFNFELNTLIKESVYRYIDYFCKKQTKKAVESSKIFIAQ